MTIRAKRRRKKKASNRKMRAQRWIKDRKFTKAKEQ
jgi:hypothetical protein